MCDEDPDEGHGKRGSVASFGALASNPVRQGLSKLQKKYPFLARPTHELYPLVQRCDEAIRAGDNERAKDELMRIEQEVEHEESTLQAAFNLFKPSDSATLRPPEITTMMEYLGFPATPADVEELLKVVDKDGDGQMSFREFFLYVGCMGGSHELFKIRRGRIMTRMGASQSSDALGEEIDPAFLAEELKAVGIMAQEQAYWLLVLPRAPEEFSEAARLTDCQKSAVRHIRKLAQSNHAKALPVLQRRVREMKHSDNDLWMTLAYIRELAPILVHVNLDKMMPHFEKDTHYRNQFETATSGGLLKPEVRKKWERDLFGGCYDSASGFERCKYGVLNAMNDHQGVRACRQYGESYLVLKDVRLRCTFSPEDSANLPGDRLAVLDYYAHVLNEYSQDELLETIKIAKSSEAAVLGDSSKVGKMKYKEAQLHGEVSFGKHVERLVAHQRHRDQAGSAERLAAICEKHGWQFSWMDEEQQRMQNEEMSKLGEDAWKQKLKAAMDKGTPDVEGVPPGFCRKGCSRKVAPGCTDRGRPFSTCCRGCALGFGHDLTCGNIDPELVKPGMCLNGCGRPVNPGRTAAGRKFTTCCRGCGRGEHDASCGLGDAAKTEPLCKFGCGCRVAASTGDKKFDTCCRACAKSSAELRKHDRTCRGPG